MTQTEKGVARHFTEDVSQVRTYLQLNYEGEAQGIDPNTILSALLDIQVRKAA